MTSIQHFEEKNKKVLKILFFIILALGLFFRFYQYLMGRSLWEDEAHLALSFVNRGYLGLLKPLDHIQAAPPLYLWSVETFTRLGGNDACSLRALPFLSSILTLPLFYFIILSLTRSRIAALIGFFPFAVNLAVIYYSSELKTYELDVAVYLLMIYLAVSQHKFVVARRNLLLGIAGCISLLYSNVAFIILFCVACSIILNWIKNKQMNRGELLVLTSWAVVFITYYLIFIYHHPYAAIQRYNYEFGFPPLPLFSQEFNEFMKLTIDQIGFSLLLYVSESYGFAYILLLIFLVAIGHAIYRRHYALLLFTCLPVLLHFIMAIFKIYPFWYRLILYLVPPLMILMSYGAFIITQFLFKKVHTIAAVAFVLICSYFFTVKAFRHFPLYYREVKPVLDVINKDYPNTPVYISTPYTLYEYYYLTGYAKNSHYEGLDWNNNSMSPETYYKAVESTPKNYILLHAMNESVDSFHHVMADLRKRNLIVKEFSYKTYVVSEIKPLNDSGWLNIDYTYFPADKVFEVDRRRVIPFWWNSDASTKPISLNAGKYKISIVSKGTPAAGAFPHLNILVNDTKIGDLNTPPDYTPVDFEYEQKTDGNITIKLSFDNDLMDESKKEDRNALVHTIRISRIN